MAYIKIINNERYTLLNDEYQNLELVKTISYPLYIPGSYPGLYRDNPDPLIYDGHVDSDPVLAVVVDTPGRHAPAPLSMTRVGNVFNFRLYGGPNPDQIGTDNIRFAVFDRPRKSVEATGLIRLFDAQRRVVFDSDRKYMRVKRISKQGQVTESLSGRKIALVYNSIVIGYNRVQSGGVLGMSFAGTFMVPASDGSVSTVSKMFASTLGGAYIPPGWPAGASIGTFSGMVLDITGYV